MLKYEDFEKLLESKKMPSSYKLKECYELLRYDANNDMRLIDKIYPFYSLKLVPQGIAYSHELHSIIQLYLKRKSEFGGYDSSELYFIETIYYFYVDSLSECIHNVNIIQDSKTALIQYKVASLSYAITVLTKRSLIHELQRYVDLTHKYLKHKEIDERQCIILYLNLLDIYALNGEHDKFVRAREELETLFSKIKDESILRQFKFYLEIHRLNHRVLLNLDDDMDTLYEDLKNSMMLIKNAPDISDDYAMILLPVFRKLDNKLSINEKIEYITILLNQETSIDDKIEMYHYLFEEEKIDKFAYPDLMGDYYDILSKYYTDSKINKTNEIKSELENYQMSLDYSKVKSELETDPMTGLHNRIAYEKAFPKIKDDFERHIFERGAVCVFDLDGLKMTNDTKGHAAGDELIKRGAETLASIFNTKNFRLYRIGGDEFVCFAMNVSEADLLAKFQMIEAIEAEEGFSVSKGYSFMNRKDMNPVGKAFAKADEEMYKCKEKHHQKTPRVV